MRARSCLPEEIDLVVSMLDEEFIYSKKRALSLERRFPGVFAKENCDNLFVGIEKNEIVSIITTKPFRYRTEERTLQGAMFGGVLTAKKHRNKGYASQLMRWAQSRVSEKAVDFIVLWTQVHSFYERIGWTQRDLGRKAVLALSEGFDVPQTNSITFNVVNDSTGLSTLDRFRQRLSGGSWIERGIEHYGAIPIPAESTSIVVISKQRRNEGYFIYGKSPAGWMFVYEALGLRPLGKQLIYYLKKYERASRVFINDFASNSFYDDIDVAWEDQNQAMYIAFRGDISLERIYIPYLDRI